MELFVITVATLLLSFVTAKAVTPNRKEEPICKVDLISIPIFDNLGTVKTTDVYEHLNSAQKCALHILQEKKDIQLFNAFVHSVNMSDREIEQVKEILTLKSI